MPYPVTFLWTDGDKTFDQTAFGAIAPNGDFYIATRRNAAKKQIVVTKVQSGTGVKTPIVTLTSGVDFVAAGDTQPLLHPAGHLIVVGVFANGDDWSPGYIVVPKVIPPFSPNAPVTVVDSGVDTIARNNANAAALQAANAMNQSLKTAGDVRTFGEQINGVIKNAKELLATVTKTETAVKNLISSSYIDDKIRLAINKLRDEMWARLIMDRVFVDLENAASPIRNRIAQAAQAAVNALKK